MADTASGLQYRQTIDEEVAALLKAGYSALTTGAPGKAEQLFRHAVQLDVRSAAAWQALAETQIGARRAICLQWAVLADQVARHAATPPATSNWQRRSRRIWQTALTATLSIVGALTILLVGSDLLYQRRVLPGVMVGSIDVGGQPFATMEQTLSSRTLSSQRMVQLRADGRSWRVPLHTLLPDQAAITAAAVRAYGHQPDFWQRSATRARALLGRQQAVVTSTANYAAVRNVVAALSVQLSQPQRDAQIVATAQGWTLIPEQTGRQVDQAATASQLIQLVEAQAWEPQSTPLVFEIPLSHQAPRRTAAQLEPVLAQLQQLQSQPLELRAGEQRWTMDRSMLMRLDTSAQPTLLLSEQALEQQLDRLAEALAVAPQPSRLEREGDRVRALVLGQPGQALDRDQARQQIAAALQAGTPGVELPIQQLPPPPGEVEQLGLIAELGRGESQFLTYTSPERDANVQAGGNDIDGRLIAPGEVFSFTAAVGEISEAKGYRWGEAIEAGVVVPSLGGGICQVSTTVFRAAFWSGLEIVERHNHTWRLPWYEVDAPPGMDATIALGGPDLKFRNNTEHYILIKVETDLATKHQTVIIYGTPDGRKVEMQALDNGNIGIYRSVVSGTQLVGEDTFVSYYSQ